MKGRTMFVVPFCMGPLDSPYSKFGVQLTDSPYVVVNMKIMTRMGTSALRLITDDTFFLVCWLSSRYNPFSELLIHSFSRVCVRSHVYTRLVIPWSLEIRMYAGLATLTTSTSATFRTSHPYGRTVRATVAMPCSARSAMRFVSPPCWVARKVGSLSTC